MTTRIIMPTTRKERRPLLNGGGNRGARLGLAVIESFNRASSRFEVAPTYFDPMPGRALSLAEDARKRGIDARGEEGRIEDWAENQDVDGLPVLLNTDSPTTDAIVLKRLGSRASAILAYKIVELPDGRVCSISTVVRPTEPEHLRSGEKLFAALGRLTERSGSDAILGPRGSVAARALEPQMRRAFAAHTVKNLGKILSGLTPESAPFEVGNGIDSAPLYIRETDGRQDPEALVASVANDPDHPMRRGTSFSVAEIVTPTGEVRIHDARRRAVDDQVRTRSRSLLEQSVIDRSVREGNAQRRAAEEEAARRSERPDDELSQLFAQVLVPQPEAIERPRTTSITQRSPIRATD
jgi:hypothetical protein